MRFDGIDCQGEFLVDRVASLPVWSSAYEGRMLYAEDTDRLHIGTNSAWRLLTKTTDDVDLTATAAEINTLCDGITATAAELNYMDGITTPLIHSGMVRGGLDRSIFRAAPAGTGLFWGPGMYHHMAQTQEQIVYWDEELYLGMPYLSDYTWYYLYLDSSAIQSHGSPLLTNAQFTFTLVPPVYDYVRGGFYYKYDRCIFAFYNNNTVTGVSDIKQFYHDGGEYVHYDVNEIDLNVYALIGGWHPVTLEIPDFGENAQALVNFWGYASGEESPHRPADLYYRKFGSTTTGHVFTRTRGKYCGANVNQGTVTVNYEQKIQIKWYYSTEWGYISVFTDGYVLPGGM